MNKTQYGNTAVGQDDSVKRLQSDITFLAEKLRLMEIAADELRASFVPNTESHPAIRAYNEAKSFRG